MAGAHRYFRVDLDHDASCSMVGAVKNWNGVSRFKLTEVERLVSWPSNMELVTAFVIEEGHDERLLDYVDIPSPGVPAVSRRARSVIESVAPRAVQFLPIRIFSKTEGRLLGTYWVMNILDSVAGLSYTHTQWLGYPSTPADETAVTGILKPALVGELVKGHHLFRLDVNGRPFQLFASEFLRQALIAADAADGFAFHPVLVV